MALQVRMLLYNSYIPVGLYHVNMDLIAECHPSLGSSGKGPGPFCIKKKEKLKIHLNPSLLYRHIMLLLNSKEVVVFLWSMVHGMVYLGSQLTQYMVEVDHAWGKIILWDGFIKYIFTTYVSSSHICLICFEKEVLWNCLIRYLLMDERCGSKRGYYACTKFPCIAHFQLDLQQLSFVSAS